MLRRIPPLRAASQRSCSVDGIHGENAPCLIPGRGSHGCVRVPNRAIKRLYRLLPVARRSRSVRQWTNIWSIGSSSGRPASINTDGPDGRSAAKRGEQAGRDGAAGRAVGRQKRRFQRSHADFRNIFALTTLLERGQLEVVSAESGEEGIALLKQMPDIDIVLMDIMMPVMDSARLPAAAIAPPSVLTP